MTKWFQNYIIADFARILLNYQFLNLLYIFCPKLILFEKKFFLIYNFMVNLKFQGIEYK